MSEPVKLSSNSVHVFPTTKRTMADKRSKLLSESNLTNIVNMLLDRESFVISNKFSIEAQNQSNSVRLTSDTSMEFNILGYYFKIDSIQELLNELFNYTSMRASSQDGHIYVYANISTVKVGEYTELYGTDDIINNESKYGGVLFSFTGNTAEGGVTDNFLKILEILVDYPDRDYCIVTVPVESLVKFDGRSIGPIDLGEI